MEGRQHPHLASGHFMEEKDHRLRTKKASRRQGRRRQQEQHRSGTTMRHHLHEHKTKCCFFGHGAAAAPYGIGSDRTVSRWKLKAAFNHDLFRGHFSQGGLGWQLEVERHFGNNTKPSLCQLNVSCAVAKHLQITLSCLPTAPRRPVQPSLLMRRP
jgi:hypothetical protein